MYVHVWVLNSLDEKQSANRLIKAPGKDLSGGKCGRATVTIENIWGKVEKRA